MPSAAHHVVRGVVAQPDHRDDREAGPPDGRRQQREPDGHALAQPDRVVAEVDGEVDGQQQTAAEVAERPAARGDVVALVLGGDVDQDRVVADQRAAGEDARDHDRHGAELPALALHEEQQPAEERAGPGVGAHVPLLAVRTVDEGADDRQHEGARDGGEAGEVEGQRPGREVEPEHADRLAAGLVRVDTAGGLAGDGDHVRREEDRQHRRVERGVGPVVPVPGLLVLRAPQRAKVGDGLRARTSRHRRVLHRPLSVSTALSMSVRSVIRPSTPRSRSVFISSGSSMVQTCTWTPARWARRTSPGGDDRERAPPGAAPGAPAAVRA